MTDRSDRDPVAHGEDGGFRVIEEHVPDRSPGNDAVVAGAAAVATLAGAGFAIALLVGLPLEVYASMLAIALLALAVAVRRFFGGAFPHVIATEPRVRFPDEDEPIAEVETIGRRGLLGRLLAVAGAVLGAALLAPVTALGPRFRPPVSAWRDGARLVTPQGDAIRPEDVPPGGLALVWPEGEVRREDSSVILVRLSDAVAGPPTDLEGVIDGRLVAYSKVCTHAGCPVGLFRERENTLFCPCHQASFDAARGAEPTFGPPSRPLPQLPLGVDAEGFLVATGPFTARVGPPLG